MNLLTPNLPVPGPQTVTPRSVQLLALCGSLRRQSRCLALLQAMGLRVPAWATFRVHDNLGGMPLFNPDDETAPPAPVLRLWAAVEQADAIVIASPEYAHGVTGTIKNTLDWLVGYPPFAGKLVAVVNPSHRAEHADLSLKETLRTMAAQVVDAASLRIPVMACELDASQLANTASFSGLIDAAFEAMRCAEGEAAPDNADNHSLTPAGQQHPQLSVVGENH